MRENERNNIIHLYVDFGINADGTRWEIVYSASNGSPVWVKTTTDMLGRSVKTERPGYGGVEVSESSYNDQGQLIKTSTDGQPDTLYVYDELGKQIRSGLDINANGTLDLASTDRITESETSYESESSDWFLQTVSKVYSVDSSATAITNSVSRRKLTGLTGGTRSVASVFDILGNETITTTTVDPANKLVTQTTDVPDSASNIVTIAVNGLLQSSTTAHGSLLTYSYDALARQTRSETTGGTRSVASVTHYDTNHGWVDYVEDAAGHRTTFTYDPASGRLLSKIDPLSNTTYFTYTAYGQPEKTWGSGPYPVSYEYDSYGHQTKQHTYRGGSGWSGATWPGDPGTADTTTWGYHEGSGLLTSKQDAAGKSVSYTYSTGGRLATRTWARTVAGVGDPGPLVATYSYSTAGDLTGLDYSDTTPAVTFTCDRLGRQTTASSSISSHEFAYVGLLLNRETITINHETSTITNIIDHSNDAYGRSTGFTVAGVGDPGYSVTYGYDPVGRFSSLTSDVCSLTSAFNYSYLPNSDLLFGYTVAGVGDPGLSVSRSYEDHRNLLTQVKNQSGTNIIAQFDYSNDAVGRRTQRVDSLAKTNSFGYDSRSQLISAAMDTNNYSYTYDPIGNRIAASNNAEEFHYTANELNQYTLITDGVSNNLSYDADGNLTNDNIFAYEFNSENRLIGATPLAPSGNSRKVEYAYDYKGRRVLKTAYAFDGTNWNATADEVRRNIYDDFNLIAEIIETPSATNIQYYTWGLDLSGTLQGAGGVGGLLSMTRQTAASTNIFFYMADANGNISDLVDINGTSVASYQYSPYGQIVSATGVEANNNTITFSTKPWDADIRKYTYIFRDYEPESGRWSLSRDPIGEEAFLRQARENIYIRQYTYNVENSSEIQSLYLFLHNHPGNVVDAFGLQVNDVNQVSRTLPACGKCGREVPLNLFSGTLRRLITVTKRFNDAEKTSACDPWTLPTYVVLSNPHLLNQALRGWDLKQLFEWENYCRSDNCGIPQGCENSIWVKGGCYNTYEVNYVLYGYISKICGSSREHMLSTIFWYRMVKEHLPHHPWWGEDMTQGAQAWANAGFDFWPERGGNIPSGNAIFTGCEKCGESLSMRLTSTWPPSGVF